MSVFGYIRVSAKDQCIDRQMQAMKEFCIPDENVFIDKMSGQTFDRPAYIKLLGYMKKGDLLVVLSIDRLGRNYKDIQKQWHMLTKQMNVDILVLDMPLLDTRKKDEYDLTGVFIADIVLQILAYVAEIERKNIKQRQKEGIFAAKDRGVKFGRPKKDIPEDFELIYEKWKNQQINSREASKILGVSQGTFLKWSHEKSH